MERSLVEGLIRNLCADKNFRYMTLTGGVSHVPPISQLRLFRSHLSSSFVRRRSNGSHTSGKLTPGGGKNWSLPLNLLSYILINDYLIGMSGYNHPGCRSECMHWFQWGGSTYFMKLKGSSRRWLSYLAAPQEKEFFSIHVWWISNLDPGSPGRVK